MIGFTSSQRYYLSRQAADMRKSYDGLGGVVRQGLGRDPLSGEVFIFLNRRRTMEELVLILEGVLLRSVRHRKRYSRPQAAVTLSHAKRWHTNSSAIRLSKVGIGSAGLKTTHCVV